jgi:hypothetical protein
MRMGVVRLWRPGGGRLPRVGDARLPILGHARLPILGHARLRILGHARLPILGAASVAVIVLVGALDSGASEPVKQRRAAAGQPASTEAPTAWAGSVPASPAQLGLELQSLLGQHVVLAADMMRGRLRDDPDLAQAANGALGENTTDLGALVAAAFGAPARRQFTPQWSGHVTALFNYARRLAEGDAAALAATLLPPAAARTLQQPTWRLRSELGRLLGEHVVLTVAAMRAAVSDSPDFPTAARSVDDDTRDLAGAVGVLFGPAAGRQFQGLWADHVDLLVAYSAAVAADDQARRTDAIRGFAGFEQALSTFLAGAAGNRATAATLAKALQGHDRMLQRQVDAFVAEKYVDSRDIAYSTYQEMDGLAGRLSEGFGASVASRLPVGAAETGRGGMVWVAGGR